MGFVRKNIGGEQQIEVAREAGDIQAEAAKEALDFQKETLETQRRDLAPFRTLLSGDLQDRLQMLADDVPAAGLDIYYERGEIPTTIGDMGAAITPEDVGDVDVLNDPVYQALAEDAQRRVFGNQAARGKLGSGETAEQLQQRLLTMGDQLRSSETQRRLARRGQFVGEQAQGRQLDLATLQGQFGQQVGARQLALQENQRRQQSALARRSVKDTNFNQLMDLARLSQASAAGQAAAAGQSGRSVADLYTQAANAQAAGLVGGANAAGQQQQAALNTAGILGAAAIFSDYRVKENIQYKGEINGIPWFKFDYIDGAKDQQGTMAQLIEDEYPDAVSEKDGFLMVDYARLPIWQ